MIQRSEIIEQTQAIIDTYALKAGLSQPISSIPTFGTALALAPMAGITGPAYRLLNRMGGAECAFTEMISCEGLMHASQKSKRLMVPPPM